MNKKLSLNMTQLKYIAVLCMLIDHGAALFLERGVGLAGDFYMIDRILRGIGRTAFPIFCFGVVEGFCHTKNVREYLKRLILFALISEIPFDLVFRNSIFNMTYQNTFWTLAFGLAALMICTDPLMGEFQKIFGLMACLFVPRIFNTDYSTYGVLTILAMYYFRKEPLKMCMAGYIVLLVLSTREIWSVFGFLLILLYNGERGHGKKEFFYLFYPLHLVLLLILKPYAVMFLSQVYAASVFI